MKFINTYVLFSTIFIFLSLPVYANSCSDKSIISFRKGYGRSSGRVDPGQKAINLTICKIAAKSAKRNIGKCKPSCKNNGVYQIKQKSELDTKSISKTGERRIHYACEVEYVRICDEVDPIPSSTPVPQPTVGIIGNGNNQNEFIPFK